MPHRTYAQSRQHDNHSRTRRFHHPRPSDNHRQNPDVRRPKTAVIMMSIMRATPVTPTNLISNYTQSFLIFAQAQHRLGEIITASLTDPTRTKNQVFAAGTGFA
nr:MULTISPECIES: hypothetical protein [unclassified Pseudomonas]